MNWFIYLCAIVFIVGTVVDIVRAYREHKEFKAWLKQLHKDQVMRYKQNE